jgi:cytochrome d ubiquinol oxidase subunit I
MLAGLDALFLARAQFAFTIGFHIVLPAFSIGLASYLMVLEGLWLTTGKPKYLDTFRYWLKIFALVFAMGVVSGLVMSYQFGTNWSVFSDKTGPILGPLMGYEVLTAFFLEAGFLGVMLFGMNRVGPGLHFAATCLVAFGTVLSAFWILSVNSWMQTPQGFILSPEGRFLPGDWWAIIFNPSFPYRFAHMVTASYLSVAFVVGAVGAWHLIWDHGNVPARTMFSMAMWMAAIVAPAQVLIGDMHGLNTLAHQPAKVAAMEGHFETQRGAPLILFGWPNMTTERTDYAVEIPLLGSIILTHDANGEIKGLKAFPPSDRPYAPVVFWAFRIMVGLGLTMAGLGVAGVVLRVFGKLYETRWLLWSMVFMAPSGFIAVLAGWTVTEVGRQPFTVFGLLRTADSVSPIAAPGVATSFAAFAAVYLLVFGAGLGFLVKMMARAPIAGEPGPTYGVPVRSAGITPLASVTVPGA